MGGFTAQRSPGNVSEERHLEKVNNPFVQAPPGADQRKGDPKIPNLAWVPSR